MESVSKVLPDIMRGQPDALVVQKGTALHCLAPFAGQVPWMLQTAVYSPHAPGVDYQIAFVEEAVALGAEMRVSLWPRRCASSSRWTRLGRGTKLGRGGGMNSLVVRIVES